MESVTESRSSCSQNFGPNSKKKNKIYPSKEDLQIHMDEIGTDHVVEKEESQNEPQENTVSCKVSELQDMIKTAANELWEEQRTQLLTQQAEIEMLMLKVELLRSNYKESQSALLMTEQELTRKKKPKWKKWVSRMFSLCRKPSN